MVVLTVQLDYLFFGMVFSYINIHIVVSPVRWNVKRGSYAPQFALAKCRQGTVHDFLRCHTSGPYTEPLFKRHRHPGQCFTDDFTRMANVFPCGIVVTLIFLSDKRQLYFFDLQHTLIACSVHF